ncbi:UNVERIFIED_CONTAM: hypothetical protein FKN15_005738 [Acipenser sinensis]
MVESEKIFTELIRSIEKIHTEVIELIGANEKAAVNQAEGRMKKLEQEISELRRRNAELKQLSETEDHIHFLQTHEETGANEKAAVNHTEGLMKKLEIAELSRRNTELKQLSETEDHIHFLQRETACMSVSSHMTEQGDFETCELV